MPALKLYYQVFPIFDENGNPKGDIARPIVQILVNHKHGKIVGPLKAIVDSGADYNLFPADFGDLMGIKIRSGEPWVTEGIGGQEVRIFRHWGIKIFLEGFSFDTFIDFSYEVRVPLLGQQGFFDKVKSIKFVRPKEEFLIEPK